MQEKTGFGTRDLSSLSSLGWSVQIIERGNGQEDERT